MSDVSASSTTPATTPAATNPASAPVVPVHTQINQLAHAIFTSLSAIPTAIQQEIGVIINLKIQHEAAIATGQGTPLSQDTLDTLNRVATNLTTISTAIGGIGTAVYPDVAQQASAGSSGASNTGSGQPAQQPVVASGTVAASGTGTGGAAPVAGQ